MRSVLASLLLTLALAASCADDRDPDARIGPIFPGNGVPAIGQDAGTGLPPAGDAGGVPITPVPDAPRVGPILIDAPPY